jgi:hypothetical protein
MSEKKMVRRSVAIVLGVICIILAVGLAGAFAYYVPMVNDRNSMIANLNDTVNLAKSTVWIQNATAWPEGGNQFSASYCGYIKVDINCTLSPYVSHPLARLTVRVTYATLGISYDDNQTIVTAGSAFFPDSSM